MSRHAADGMACERPPIKDSTITRVLEEPDHDDQATAWKWINGRTVIVRYREDEQQIWVASVSATRRRLLA